ncbi:unnamed protein product [Rotaria sordida]|uniref:Uncharacterized protein n=1 Tax=Rotaria sordida TaxID=392033 RepID=A0A819Q1H3_9BILA|nr:unnamed protein product [Rotaria sordida]
MQFLFSGDIYGEELDRVEDFSINLCGLNEIYNTIQTPRLKITPTWYTRKRDSVGAHVKKNQIKNRLK